MDYLRLMSTSISVTYRNLPATDEYIYLSDIHKYVNFLDSDRLYDGMNRTCWNIQNLLETFRICWRHSEFVEDIRNLLESFRIC